MKGLFGLIKKEKEVNKRLKQDKIFVKNIEKRLEAILNKSKVKYFIQGKILPRIYQRWSGLFRVAVSNTWDFDENYIIVDGGLESIDNPQNAIRIVFQGGDMWNGGIITVSPHSFMYGDGPEIEAFFEYLEDKIKRFAVDTEGGKA